MRFGCQRLALLVLASVSLGPFAACHALAAPDAPRAPTPTIEIDVEDRGPERAFHSTHFSMSILDGKAWVTAHDSDAHYEIDARAQATPEPSFAIKLKRSEPKNAGDIELVASIPQRTGARVLVAKIDRADGHATSVVAQVR